MRATGFENREDWMRPRHRRHWRRAQRHGWGRGRFFGPGEVRLALLALLVDEPKHGYELMKELEERSEGTYQASAGTVYPTLQQLEDEGLVRVESAEGKKVYHLTPEGQREVAEARDHVEQIWRRAREWGDWQFVRDPAAAEIVRPALRLARAAYRVVTCSHGDPDVIDRVREILDDAREDIDTLRRRPRA